MIKTAIMYTLEKKNAMYRLVLFQLHCLHLLLEKQIQKQDLFTNSNVV